MIPVSDVIPSRTSPAVTLALILLIAGAFAYELQLDDLTLGALLEACGTTSTRISPARLIVSMFLHAGWVHVAVNTLYLWLFGPNVEDAVGRTRFLLLYLAAGVVSGLVQSLVHPVFTGPLIGASGAVSGILGAYLVLYPQSRLLTVFFRFVRFDLIELPAMAFLGVWFVLQLAADIGSFGVPVTVGAAAFWSHVTGFLFGMMCGGYGRWRSGVLRKYWIRGATR
jgi:rhomboid family protein